ncbi:MAG: hypothetical protein P1T08_10470 [Acidimicrobiia bacterium]|nr:hypothetical protein [Acidimicrobiia bacterium]
MKVVISDDGRFALFRLGPLEALLALKRELEVPVDRITSARAMARGDVSYGPIIRAPGTYIPGLVRFGSYGRKPNRHFWAVFRQDPVLVVESENWDYTRLVVGVRDAGHTAGALQVSMS